MTKAEFTRQFAKAVIAQCKIQPKAASGTPESWNNYHRGYIAAITEIIAEERARGTQYAAEDLLQVLVADSIAFGLDWRHLTKHPAYSELPEAVQDFYENWLSE